MSEQDACAARFNAQAAREGWSVICDSSLAFMRPEHRRLLEIWRSAAGPGGVPRRRDISHRCLKDLLARVAIYERIAAPDRTPRFRVRLIGTQFAEVIGELTGRFVDEAVPPRYLPRWHAVLEASLVAMGPLRFLTRADAVGKQFLIGECFEAPLLSDDGEPTLILGAGYFSSDSTWSQQYLSETRGILQ